MKNLILPAFHEIDPFYDCHSEILILGSFPSPKSRETGFYYGHPQNRFWKILSLVFGEPAPVSTDEKKNFLRRHRIALWDVIASCEIAGAGDQSIRNPVPNDISLILSRAPIRKILTTGTAASRLYRKLCLPVTGVEAVALPSPSPANCATPLSVLTEVYRKELTNG